MVYDKLYKERRLEKVEGDAGSVFGEEAIKDILDAANHEFTLAEHRANTVETLLLAQILVELRGLKK